MVRRWMLVLGFVFFIAAAAYAEPPKIIKGYGLTEWGQSVEQVKKVVSNLKEVTPSSWSNVKKDLISEYVTPGQESFKEIQYWFADGKLFRVSLMLSDRIKKEVGSSFINALLNRKYWQDKEAKDLLTKEGISVRTTLGSSGEDLQVSYEKQSIVESAEEKAKKEIELKRQETTKELRLEDLL